MRAADYTYFEGITFRNAEIAILAGTQFIAGAKGLTVKRSRFENVGAGVFTNYSGSSNFYIADNTFIGRNDPKHLIGWAGDMWTQFDGVDGQIFPPAMASYVAVKLYGPGHVVAYNYIADFHDGINVETYGNPGRLGRIGSRHRSTGRNIRRASTGTGGRWRSTSTTTTSPTRHDNPIETDGSMHNIRVMRNMLINHASHAFCNQPALGGPVYWIRNIAYHLPGGSTRLTGGAAGVIFYNNTILSETAGGRHAEHALAQQPDARPELGARDLQRHDQHQLHLVRLQRLPPESRRRRLVSLELAAVRGRDGLHQAPAAARARDARVRDAWPSTARPPGRTATACWSTTTSS